LEGSWGQRANCIARGIANLVEAGYRVTDKETGELRDCGWGDVAVLCRSNARLVQIATACAKAGIPVAFKRPELLKTPEGALAMACLRRLADPRDTLASAEIRTLTKSDSPEAWLAERLEFLAAEKEHWKWGEAGQGALQEIVALAEAQSQVAVLTPTEALELALRKGGVREAAIAWGPTADNARHRLRNIDLLIEYARTYEDQCNMQNVAATVSGLILWLNELAKRKEDWQAEAGDGRAVTLVTHHRAKGLEWPIVVAVDLDADVQSRLWDLTVRPREDGFDMYDPLDGRSLRYWLWPYGGRSKDIPVLDRIRSSADGQQAQAQAEAETRRLLYVSMTRARDLLVMPLPADKPTGQWLQTLAVDWAVPEGNCLELPSGKVVKTLCEVIDAPEDWRIEAPDYEARWVIPGQPREDLLKQSLSPSSAEPLEGASAGEIVEIGEPLNLGKHLDEISLGQAFHTIIAAEINAPDDQAASRAARVLMDWGFEGVIEPVGALAVARRFIAWVQKTFAPIAWHVEYPMAHVLDTGQVVRGSIDVLLQTKEGWVIIDHKATQKPRSMWQEVAVSYSGQLAMYKTAVEAISDRPVTETWIHCVIGGGALQLQEFQCLSTR
jgi:ATP-dependent exoDNAse (exonuclease V) beta subunit